MSDEERMTNARRGYLARQRMAAHDLWQATSELSDAEEAVSKLTWDLDRARVTRDRARMAVGVARGKLAEATIEPGTRGQYDDPEAA